MQRLMSRAASHVNRAQPSPIPRNCDSIAGSSSYMMAAPAKVPRGHARWLTAGACAGGRKALGYGGGFVALWLCGLMVGG